MTIQQEHILTLLQHVLEHYDNHTMYAFSSLFPGIWNTPIDFDGLEEYSPNLTAFPLLKLVTLNPSRAVFEQAYAAYPEALLYEYEGMSTFWSAACRHGSLAVVECFMTMYNNNNNKTSFHLHTAISSNATPEIIRYLVQYHPTLLQHVGDVGRLPLHTACAADMSTATLQIVVEGYAEALTVTDWWDNLPLHLACRNGAPIETLELLLRMNPSLSSLLLQQRNDNGESPFFCALRCRETTPSTLQWFFQKSPELLYHCDNYGETALHAVCYEGSTINVQWLLNHYSHVPTLQDQKGNTPLHVALQHSPTPYAISTLLLQDAPECCAMRGESGQLPLHIVFRPDLSFEFLEYLLEKFPEASETMDDEGRFPLHMASRVDGIPLDVVELLMATCPLAISSMDHHGQRPVDYARSSRNPSGALVTLLTPTVSLEVGGVEVEPKQKKQRVDGVELNDKVESKKSTSDDLESKEMRNDEVECNVSVAVPSASGSGDRTLPRPNDPQLQGAAVVAAAAAAVGGDESRKMGAVSPEDDSE